MDPTDAEADGGDGGVSTGGLESGGGLAVLPPGGVELKHHRACYTCKTKYVNRMNSNSFVISLLIMIVISMRFSFTTGGVELKHHRACFTCKTKCGNINGYSYF